MDITFDKNICYAKVCLNNFIEILLAEKIQDDKLCFLVIEDKLI